MQYDGHYLVDLGQKDSSNQVQIFEKYKKNATLHDNEYYDNLRRMGGEYYGKGFFLHPTASKDAWVTYAIEPSPYQTMCFAVGAIDDRVYNVRDYVKVAALQVYLDGQLSQEELIHTLDPVRWFSLDIRGKSSISFKVSHDYESDFLGVFEVSLWNDAEHRIDESKPKATIEENIDDTCDVIHSHGDFSIYHLKTGNFSITMDNVQYSSGFCFSPVHAHHQDNAFSGQRATYNTFGRYRYIGFLMGHIDKSQETGGVILDVFAGTELVKQIRFIQTDLPQFYAIDIQYAHYVTFVCSMDPDGGDQSTMGSVSGYGIVNIVGAPTEPASSLPKKPVYDGSYKVLSQIGRPYNFVNHFDVNESIFRGESPYYGIQIGGVIYTEGLLMKSIFGMMTSTAEQIPASADFDLDNQFKFATFFVGRRDRTAITNDKLRVYVDGVQIREIELNSIGTIQRLSVGLNFGRTLRIELVGNANTYRGTYGIVDLAFHTDLIDNNLDFVHTPQTKLAAADAYESNTTLKLMRDLCAFDSFSGQNDQNVLTDDRNNDAEYTENGGRSFLTSTQQRFDTGFVLETGNYLGYGFGDGPSVAILICGEPLLVAMGSQSVHMSSFASFAVRGKFKHLEFDVCSLDGYQAGETKSLRILGDTKVLKSETVTSGAEKHVSVDITNVSTLVFLLDYGEGCETPFGFYNLYVSN